MKRFKAVILMILILLALGGLGYVSYFGVQNSGSIHDIKLGLDLAGGVSITYEVNSDGKPSQEDMADTIYKLQKRVEQYSTEAQVYQEGSDRIDIEIPGAKDANAILEELGQPGNLYFIKEKDSSGKENYTFGTKKDGTYGYVLNNKTIEQLQADGSIVLVGNDVANAEAAYENSGTAGKSEPVVSLEFTKDGTTKFANATTEAYKNGESIGIYYDGNFVSVPKVEAAITDGKAVINGMSDFSEAQNLASTIRIGGLKLQLTELRSNVVGAQLGSNAIHSSLIAALVGFALIVVFMLSVYRLLGLAASIALSFYCGFVIVLLSAFNITLTLPGVAGIVLSIGMAVDANVLVFARIKEEIMAGKSVKKAMELGYHKALSAILDGNITTLIAAAVLGLRGTGSVKGFAQTLALGIFVSMFTALFVTRGISSVFYKLGFEKEKWYGRAKEHKNIPFIKNRKYFYIASVVLMLIGFSAMAYHGANGTGMMNYSLDFVGGTATTVTFNENWTTEKLDQEVVPKIESTTGVKSVQVQTVSGTNQVVFKTTTLGVTQREALNKMLESDYKVSADNVAAETISSTISNEATSDAISAMIMALILMLIYVWIRFKDFKFGSSAIIALGHDALMVVTCYALTRIEVGGTFIAAVLTIIGYSINDTIVTFDRIRENQHTITTNEQRAELIDRSITQTLSRSLFTSLTTFFMILTLYVFGVRDIKDFALPLMVGVISGTYSSICVASPLWYDMKRTKKH